MLVALHGHLEAEFQDTLNLGAGVDIGIVGHVVVLVLLAEIHAAREFAQHHEIGSTDDLILQRRLVQQTVEGDHRAHIGIESQFLTHGQQARLRADLGRRIVVVLQVADGSEEHRISAHADLMGRVGIRIAHGLDGMGATDGLLVFKLVTTLGCHSIEHSHTLLHDLGADSIACENCNLQFHNTLLFSFSNKFNILKVALMAASVWSASRPRVRKILPLSFQVMTVCTRASVRPPGGMVTA